MQMEHSYKPVFLLAFFSHMDAGGTARIEDILDDFIDFYEDRRSGGLPVEKKASLFLKRGYSRKEAERLMLANPFKVYEEIGVMSHS